jgi:DNA repair protein RadC
LKPSRADEILTSKIAEGCKLLELKVNDHLILTPESYYSFANEGLL